MGLRRLLNKNFGTAVFLEAAREPLKNRTEEGQLLDFSEIP